MQDAEPLKFALALCARREFGAANAYVEEFLRRSPQNLEAWLLLARLALQVGNSERALEAALAATAIDSRHSDALYVRGRVQKSRGDIAAAESSYRLAVAANPGNADALTSLGLLVRSCGRLDEAVSLHRRALQVRPNHPEARKNLVNALTAADMDPGSRMPSASAQRTTREQQLRELATRLANQGQPKDAFAVVQEALQINPTAADLWLGAGTLALEMGLMAVSLGCCEEAVRLHPSSYEAINLAGRICVGSGLYERALAHSERAYALAPSKDTLLTRKLVLPAIGSSAEALRTARRQYEEGLDEILASDWRPLDPYNCLQLPTFFLAYHGESERDLQIKAAQMCLHAIPDLAMTAPHCLASARRPGRIRVGFISRYLASHSIGKTTRGLIDKLGRDRFEVHVLRITPSVEDDTTRLICAAADGAVQLDKSIPRAREQIAALELDVLFYQDVGMESTSWFLAFARLAPVQCVSFGHPSTTGIPNMDYFISNDLFEVPEAATHYSERLFLLRNLPTLAYYYKPPAPCARPERAKFGLPPDATLYLCPQTLFKLHPDFDQYLAGILRRDSLGHVVLIRGEFDEWTRSLQERFVRTMPDVASRVVFLPSMQHSAFMELLAVGEVVLDPLHFNGMNSSLESFAVGTPVVTLPTRLQRGRHTQAMYRKMGILECIASDCEDYVGIAVRLGTDRAYNQRLREQILARNHVLFEDSTVVAELERFFLEAVQEKYGGQPKVR
jgi:predicted O-linked N-acetylglucosamine transferase (SPINDLY family)